MGKRALSLLLILLFSICAPVFADGSGSYDTIKKGAYGNDVKAMQLRLRELGYLKGEADGSYWTQTVKAVTSFQRVHYLPITPSEISGAALEVLYSPDAIPAPETVCKYGNKNDQVRTMQERLYQWGYLSTRPDGVYSDSTAEALAAFEENVWSRAWETRHTEDGIPYSESGFPTDGRSVEADIYAYFTDGSMPAFGPFANGDSGTDVKRLQRLLRRHGYLWSDPDGKYGLETQAAVLAFQKSHGLPATGSADEDTVRRVLQGDIVPCVKPDLPYRLVVDVDRQRVTAYAWDGEGYTSPVRVMVCSTGTVATPTPTGVFTDTFPQDRWHFFRSQNCWAQYSYVIDHHIMFHSGLYYNQLDSEGQPSHGGMDRASFENLGTRQSHGCVRLAVEDAGWIFQNCPKGTEVEIIQLTPDPDPAE